MKKPLDGLHQIIREDVEKRQKYFKKYWLNNTKKLREYRKKWANDERRKRLHNFTASGYVYASGRIEIISVAFYAPKKK